VTMQLRRLCHVCAALLPFTLIGCYGQETPESAGSGARIAKPTTPADDHSKGPALSEDDKALVLAQRLCPVSNEELTFGSDMGDPVKLDVNGETVFICCIGCEKGVRGNEEAILAKVAEFKSAKPD